MIKMSQKELDTLCDNYSEMNFKAGDWWPSTKDIKDHLDPNNKRHIEFAIWITETASEPQTPEEKASRKMLLNFIYKNLDVLEEESSRA